VLGSLYAGTSIYCVERFSPSRWLDDVRASGATVTNALGVMPEFIFRTPPTPFDRDHSLRQIMAVPIAAEWGEAFEQRFGVKIVQGYGMTECNIPCYTGPDDPLLPGCAGRVQDEYFEVRIVDPATDEPLPQGEVGEIIVRPKEPGCFMAGYFRMLEKTVEAWRNLWFHTGDAGRFDAAGRLFFVDRIKDCIRRRGENISAFEVEQVLNAHPWVAESAVIGVKTAGAGGEEEVKACLVVEPGSEIDNVALLDYCVERMPRYAVPRFVELVEELSKTATGKVQKQGMRDAGVTHETWDREVVGYTIARR
jgi:crotonobetaine/carnitine-CoA ligase